MGDERLRGCSGQAFSYEITAAAIKSQHDVLPGMGDGLADAMDEGFRLTGCSTLCSK